jgi:hypothetical protein
MAPGLASAELRKVPASQLRFAPDSPLEGTGFEPSVPRDTTKVSGPADVASAGFPSNGNTAGRERAPSRGTDGSNPASPSGESDALDGADRAVDPLSARAKVREAVFAPAETITAELRTASAPDLAMLGVAGRQQCQAQG